jgi:hypothetical protein
LTTFGIDDHKVAIGTMYHKHGRRWNSAKEPARATNNADQHKEHCTQDHEHYAPHMFALPPQRVIDDSCAV